MFLAALILFYFILFCCK